MNESRILAGLRARGVRVTPQRRAIAAAFDEPGSVHLSADDVLQRARALVPETSRATVYNTLRDLVELGLLVEVAIDGRPMRYDPNTATEHHHFVCQRCGLLEDVYPTGVDHLGLERPYRPERVDLVFRGLCRSCA